jgi:hypothetical protein
MMKKLLVLALVLSMAVVANAGLSISYVNGAGVDPTSGVVSVTGTLAADYPIAVLISDAALSGFAKGANAPTATAFNASAAVIFTANGETIPAGYAGQGWNIMAFSDTEYPLTGTMLTANLALNQLANSIVEEIVEGGKWIRTFSNWEATVKLYQTAEEAPVVQDGDDLSVERQYLVSEVFVPIPEPMTMLLLGLGGLFIRKK